MPAPRSRACCRTARTRGRWRALPGRTRRTQRGRPTASACLPGMPDLVGRGGGAVPRPRLEPRNAAGRRVQLRTPYVETFDVQNSQLWQSFQNGTGGSNAEAGGRLATTLAAASVQGGPFDDVDAHWGRTAGSPETSTCRPTTGCSNGRPRMASRHAGLLRGRERHGDLRDPRERDVRRAVHVLDPAVVHLPADDGAERNAEDPARRETPPCLLSRPSRLGADRLRPDHDRSGHDHPRGRQLQNRFAHQEVSVGWDDLRITSGTISCPSTWWENDSPDWQAAAS